MSFQTFTKRAAPSAPASGKASIYVATDGRPHLLDATGVDNVLSARQLDNAVRNSGWWFAQRQAPGTLTTYSSTTGRAFCADGWAITNENASAQFRRVDTGAARETGLGSRYYGEFTKTTSTGKLLITQAIESQDAQRFCGRTVRLTAKMKQVVGAAPVIRLGLLQLTSAGTIDSIPAAFITAMGANGVDPTMGTAVSRIAPKAVTAQTGTVNGNAVDCTLSSSWQTFSACFDVPTDAKNLIVAFWSNAQMVATNGFAIADAMLTDGYELQDFSAQPYAAELLRCQRYYYKSFSVDALPAASVAAGRLNSLLGKAGAVALAALWTVRFPANMRTTPTTVTLFNPGAAGAQARRVTGAAAADQTVTTSSNASDLGLEITATGDAAGTVGDQVVVHFTADAEF